MSIRAPDPLQITAAAPAITGQGPSVRCVLVYSGPQASSLLPASNYFGSSPPLSVFNTLNCPAVFSQRQCREILLPIIVVPPETGKLSGGFYDVLEVLGSVIAFQRDRQSGIGPNQLLSAQRSAREISQSRGRFCRNHSASQQITRGTA